MFLPALYLQLHSLRREAAVDAEGTVRGVAALGFDGVELIGDYGWPVHRWQAVLAETGLSVVAAHTSLEALETTDLDPLLDFHRALGNHRLVVTALPRATQTAERYHDGARRLSKAGRHLVAEGFTLAYHNHDFEFQWTEDAGGRSGLEILLEETDPAAVGFEFDTFWLEFAGRDAAAFIRQHAARTRLIHARDLRKQGHRDVPAGQGDVDFASLLPLCVAHDWPAVLEYEGPDAVEGVRQGAGFLRSLWSPS